MRRTAAILLTLFALAATVAACGRLTRTATLNQTVHIHAVHIHHTG